MEEWVTGTGHACAAALAGADGQFYAAAPAANDEGWSKVYKEDHTESIPQDDGSDMDILINEAKTLLETVNADLKTTGPPKNGFWLAGEKYKIVQKDDEFESADHKHKWILVTRPKKGAHIIETKNKTILVCVYDESLGQQSGNCKNTAVQMADYLVSENL